MLDTIRMTCPSFTERQFEDMQGNLDYKSTGDASTGEPKAYYYFKKFLSSPTLAVVKIWVDTTRWEKREGEKANYRVPSKALKVEGSVHKIMHGHNVYGGEPCPQESMARLVYEAQKDLGVIMPDLSHWMINRMDNAWAYDMGSEPNVRGWIASQMHLRHARRDVIFNGDKGFWTTGGTTTMLKAYAKEVQFHTEGGYAALMKWSNIGHAFEVLRRAGPILRVETEIKQDVFDHMASTGRASEVNQAWLDEYCEKQWRGLMRPLNDDMPIVRTSREVEARLRACHPNQWWALSLVWSKLAIDGEAHYKENVDPSTWYRHRKKLEAAHVSWVNTNVLAVNAPEDLTNFWPSLHDSRRITEVLPYPTVKDEQRAYVNSIMEAIGCP